MTEILLYVVGLLGAVIAALFFKVKREESKVKALERDVAKASVDQNVAKSEARVQDAKQESANAVDKFEEDLTAYRDLLKRK